MSRKNAPSGEKIGIKLIDLFNFFLFFLVSRKAVCLTKPQAVLRRAGASRVILARTSCMANILFSKHLSVMK